jgi:hypothetical protein
MQQETIQAKYNHGFTQTGPLAFLTRAKVPIMHHEGELRFALAEVLAALADPEVGRGLWNQLMSDEPELASLVQPTTFVLPDGSSKIADSVDIEGVFRLAQSIRSRTAERVKRWLARAARQRLEESSNPNWRPCVPGGFTTAKATAAAGSTSACGEFQPAMNWSANGTSAAHVKAINFAG